jgi:hypothetical protein
MLHWLHSTLGGSCGHGNIQKALQERNPPSPHQIPRHLNDYVTHSSMLDSFPISFLCFHSFVALGILVRESKAIITTTNMCKGQVFKIRNSVAILQYNNEVFQGLQISLLIKIANSGKVGNVIWTEIFGNVGYYRTQIYYKCLLIINSTEGLPLVGSPRHRSYTSVLPLAQGSAEAQRTIC